jgi:hypothetical protein
VPAKRIPGPRVHGLPARAPYVSLMRCSGAAPEADALQIGINYPVTQNALECCVNDPRNMRDHLIRASRRVPCPRMGPMHPP